MALPYALVAAHMHAYFSSAPSIPAFPISLLAILLIVITFPGKNHAMESTDLDALDFSAQT